MRLLTFVLVALAGLVAQANAANYFVDVGKDGDLKFVPEQLAARYGDTITYRFFAMNHSVTQSSFTEPCQPLAGGFFSAFTPNEFPNDPSPTSWTITVNDTKPIWVYCGQGKHCQNGMLQAINAPTQGNTFEAFKEKAKSAPPSTSPSNGLPVGGLRAIDVQVGSGTEFIFKPAVINEPLGTHVRFRFNPQNHSVTQSSFDKPCVPLEAGFSSGLIPTTASPSGVLFDIIVQDVKPVWFYCAQGQHCKNGMVGSINAPVTGNTHDAFVENAGQAGPGQINPKAPVGGMLTANGTFVATRDSAVIDIVPMTPDIIKDVPKPGEHDQYWIDRAGGGVIGNYSWAPDISAEAVAYLHLLHYLDNILLRVLFEGHEKLQAGMIWHNIYPDTVVRIITTMASQAWIHRATATDSLQHYDKPVMSECSYNLEDGDIDQFLTRVITLLSLEISLLIQTAAQLSNSDPWIIPCLATSLGAKSRMAGMMNMMQGHGVTVAPREVSMPANLIYSYATNKYIDSCPDGSMEEWSNHTIEHGLDIKHKTVDSYGRLILIEVYSSAEPAEGWVAWMGPWGELKFTKLDQGKTDVPKELYGTVWILVTKEKDLKASELAAHAVAGPEMLWITQPSEMMSPEPSEVKIPDATEVRVILSDGGETGSQTVFLEAQRIEGQPTQSGPFETVELDLGTGVTNKELRCQILDEQNEPIVVQRGANTDITFSDADKGLWTFRESSKVSAIICDQTFVKTTIARSAF